jgi:hypothetical protein
MTDTCRTALALAFEDLAKAPFDPSYWSSALQHLAVATGSHHGELAGWMPPKQIPLSR